MIIAAAVIAFLTGLAIGGAINRGIMEEEYDLVPKKKCRCK